MQCLQVVSFLQGYEENSEWISHTSYAGNIIRQLIPFHFKTLIIFGEEFKSFS